MQSKLDILYKNQCLTKVQKRFNFRRTVIKETAISRSRAKKRNVLFSLKFTKLLKDKSVHGMHNLYIR